jgi:hypothetical protein
MNDNDRPAGWVILRMAGPSTLRLTEALADDGFKVWTPRVTLRLPKTRRRPASVRYAPFVPTFVFAEADEFDRLAYVKYQQQRGQVRYPAFSFLRGGARVPEITDASLASLRLVEWQSAQRAIEQAQSEEKRSLAEQRKADARARRTHAPRFSKGIEVVPTDPIFMGMDGIVEGQDGEFVFVSFGGRQAWHISAWHLLPKGLQLSEPAAE